MKRLMTALAFCLLLTISGCAGCNNSWSSWKAQSFGTHWLIVQYNAMGEILFSWEFDGSVSNEGHSDGIFFTTSGGVVHLSGHYIYIQNPDSDTRKKLLTDKMPQAKNSAR